MQAYKNDTKLKTMLVKEIKHHREADQIIQGSYGTGEGKNWKGCAVGCSVHSLNVKLGTTYSTSDHSVYETALGIPEWLARLEDTIFEGLLKADAVKWPEQFAAAINVGANLDSVKWKFSAFILKENIERVLKLDIQDDLKEQIVKAIQGVLTLNENAIETGTWDESAESAAWSAAWSAAESAAESAARSAARSAAESAAWSAWSARSAAWSAWSAWSARSAAWSAARSAESAARSAARSAESAARSAAAYKKYAKELLRLLKESK